MKLKEITFKKIMELEFMDFLFFLCMSFFIIIMVILFIKFAWIVLVM